MGYSQLRRVLSALVILTLCMHVGACVARAQATSSYRQKMANLQVQNAYQQQQAAVQLAVQQTNVLLQTALRQDAAPQPSGFYRPLDFQQQQSALQLALQQSTALQQTRLRTGGGPGAAALSQVSAVQAALRQSSSLQAASQIQNGQLTTTQIQTLFSEQTNLMGLLASPAPQIPRSTSGR